LRGVSRVFDITHEWRQMISTPQHQIPFFDYPGLFAEHQEQFMSTLRDCLARGAYIMQSELFEFERELADYLGVKHAIGVADGTNALVVSLKLAHVGPGDEVIVPSHTFIATAAAVHHVGATPVLCDCLPDHMIDVDSARRVLTSRTKTIMPVQLNGRTCDMDKVEGFAAEHGLKIVEDSCQALGAKFGDRYAGTFGVAGSFSFFPAKTLGCFGDGGALIVNDDALAQEAREYRDHGRSATTGKVVRFGYNARLDNLQAAVLRIKLRSYDQAISRRRAIARIYQERFADIPQLLLPPAPDADPLRFDIFQNYEVEAQDRDRLREALAAKGVGSIIQWGGHVIHQFEQLGLRADCPYAEAMSKRYLLLPMHHLLSDTDAHFVADAVSAFYKS
jgi:dTDP-4-amino-4,6-dideoxygalactose transaminase